MLSPARTYGSDAEKKAEADAAMAVGLWARAGALYGELYETTAERAYLKRAAQAFAEIPTTGGRAKVI